MFVSEKCILWLIFLIIAITMLTSYGVGYWVGRSKNINQIGGLHDH